MSDLAVAVEDRDELCVRDFGAVVGLFAYGLVEREAGGAAVTERARARETRRFRCGG
jgi:hypothetical protein